MLNDFGPEVSVREFCDRLNNRKFYRWYPRRRCNTRKKKSAWKRSQRAARKILLTVVFIPDPYQNEPCLICGYGGDRACYCERIADA
jgi:hypothetical protein